MLPTPKYKKHENVYPPSEDTFVLLDALEKDFDNLYAYLMDAGVSCPLICELGIGSGVASIFLNELLKKKEADERIELGSRAAKKIERFFIGIDLNIDAIQNTIGNAKLNNSDEEILMECVQMSLFQGLRSNLVDILIFNPPYVVTSDLESSQAQQNPSLTTALSGGVDGRLIINNLLETINRFTSQKAVFYLVLVNENGVENIREEMVAIGWKWEKVLYRVCGWEGLHVIKFRR